MRLSIFPLAGLRVAAIGTLMAGGLSAMSAAPAAAAADLTKLDTIVGRWDMSLDDTERRCEMTF